MWRPLTQQFRDPTGYCRCWIKPIDAPWRDGAKAIEQQGVVGTSKDDRVSPPAIGVYETTGGFDFEGVVADCLAGEFRFRIPGKAW